MHKFFNFLKNIILLGILALGIWSYQNVPNVKEATNDSFLTLKNKVQQFISTGKVDLPQQDSPTHTKKIPTKTANVSWQKPEANVYIAIQNNPTLYSATVDALKSWNNTGSFLFKQVKQKKQAQIIVKTVDDSSTEAAGETYTSYNPATGHLYRAKIQLNRFYLQNNWYGYSNNRIVNTVEHELGHAIGLEHTKSVSVMYPKGSFYTIQPADIRAVKKIYHE